MILASIRQEGLLKKFAFLQPVDQGRQTLTQGFVVVTPTPCLNPAA